jgi:hypothetical protein
MIAIVGVTTNPLTAEAHHRASACAVFGRWHLRSGFKAFRPY